MLIWCHTGGQGPPTTEAEGHAMTEIIITVTETVTVTRSVTITAPAPIVPELVEDDACPDCGGEMGDCCSDASCNRYFCEWCEFGPGI